MRYSPSEKAEIIRLVEASHLPAKKTLEKLGIPRSTFYRWLDQLHAGGPEALADRPSQPGRIWNRLPETIQRDIVDMALETPSWRSGLPMRSDILFRNPRFTAC
jgi:putative transposase